MSSSRPAPSHRPGRSKWAVAREHNEETDERSNLAIHSATSAASMDKIRARNHLAHAGGRSGASTDPTSVQALDEASELEIYTLPCCPRRAHDHADPRDCCCFGRLQPLSVIGQASDHIEPVLLYRRSRHWHLLRGKSCADSLKSVD